MVQLLAVVVIVMVAARPVYAVQDTYVRTCKRFLQAGAAKQINREVPKNILQVKKFCETSSAVFAPSSA